MFKRISHIIALQFTAFIFLLFFINGAIFLFADLTNSRNQTRNRLERLSHFVVDSEYDMFIMAPRELPPMMRERVRIMSAEGEPLYIGALFADVPFKSLPRHSGMRIDGELYDVLTLPVPRKGPPGAYVQIAEIDRQPYDTLPLRSALYLLISAAVSALTYVVGLFFAKRSLRPAEHMVKRLEQFTQDASHELRTPIAVLSSTLDLSLKTGKHKEGLLSAKEDVKQVSVLVERLLELARLDQFALNLKPVDLSALVAASVEKCAILAAEKGVTLKSDISPGVTVAADAALLRQVLLNLLSNAMKFKKPSGGTVTVRLTKDMLSLEDDGIGIAEASLPHLFDRFYQADTSRAAGGGFGLGLALVKRIVELHGWTVRVKSTVGKGTTFTIPFRKA